MKRIIAAMALAAAAPAAFADCNATASDARALPHGYTVEAATIGENCETAVALLVIRSADGMPVYTNASAVAWLFGLQDVTNAADMPAALDEFIELNSDFPLMTSSELPEWAAEQDLPMQGEFMFIPEEWIDRQTYADLRASDVPVFCHVQGSESVACISLNEDYVELIGVQTFPG